MGKRWATPPAYPWGIAKSRMNMPPHKVAIKIVKTWGCKKYFFTITLLFTKYAKHITSVFKEFYIVSLDLN
jgi:hypothetical protein